jgi:2-keto-3-deoxy-L-rhamnonate aldolase RhmA
MRDALEEDTMRPAWVLRRNRLKEMLGEGKPALVMWQTLGYPEIPEMLGTTKLDAVIIDLEHASYGIQEVEGLVRACDAVGLSALVRPPSADNALVTRLLDAGVFGIVFPMIQSAEDAAHAVSCMRYAPRGGRGWGGAHTRHARWQGVYAGTESEPGAGQEIPSVYSREYVEKSEADLLTILIVETEQGVNAIDEIVTIDGVNGVIFGWGDFSLQNGFDWPRSREAAEHVFERCRAAGVGCALTPDSQLRTSFFPGCFYVVGIDSLIISLALADAVTRARREVD